MGISMRQLERKKKAPPAAAVTREDVERQFASAVGSEHFQHRDPLYHVTESFQQLFDGLGRSHAASLEAQPDADLFGGKRQAESQQSGADFLGRPPVGIQDGSPVHTFSEMAFQRGRLSASVLEGTGKVMLTSCLKRTIGQSGPQKIQQQTVFGAGSQTRNVPGHSPDRMVFNRGFVNSAVGIVVDTLRDARRTVDSMAEMAAGTGELSAADSGALRAMYPFLDDSREREMLSQYQAQLVQSDDPKEKAVLQNAISRAEALITRKAQMKIEFINKLRLISDRATEALLELQAPGAEEEIAAAVLPEQEAPEEPPPPPDGTDGRNAPDDAPDDPEQDG